VHDFRIKIHGWEFVDNSFFSNASAQPNEYTLLVSEGFQG
jgi:hypothetical protein